MMSLRYGFARSIPRCPMLGHKLAVGRGRAISSLGPSAAASHDSVQAAAAQDIDFDDLLSKPTWSVSSLLPPADLGNEPPPISSNQLHHLLRLSALPLPSSEDEERSMLNTLAAQLHFVREMQKVDTTGIEPLRAIRDETTEAVQENTITMETLKDALANEEVIGKHYKRIRRIPGANPSKRQPEDWDPLSHASRKSGKFFVVDSGRDDGE